MGFYKYTSLNVALKNLNNGLFRFTQPKYWNDPFEMKPCFTEYTEADSGKLFRLFSQLFIKKENKTLSPLDVIEFDLERKRITREKIDAIINQNIVGLSLTISPDNLIMWANYADNHRGCIIEFDETHEYFKNFPYPKIKIPYSDNRVAIDINKFAKSIESIIANTDTEEDLTKYFTKSTHWEKEQEIRLISLLDNADKMDGEMALFKIPFDCIKRIHIGCNVDSNDLRELFILRKKKELSHIEWIKYSLDNMEFKLIPSILKDLDVFPLCRSREI